MAGFEKQKKLLLFPLLLLICLAPLFFFKPQISTDIKVLLPRDKWIADHLDFLRNSQIGTVVAVSIEAENAHNAEKLAIFAADFSGKLSELPDVTGVFAKVDADKSISAASMLFQHMPQILDQHDLEQIEKKISIQGLNPILKDHYETILRPGGLFRQKMIASDPLNLFQIPLPLLSNGNGTPKQHPLVALFHVHLHA